MTGFFKSKFKEITKNIKSTSEAIQKLTKTKQDLETKISSKTKIYGLETYKILVDKLKGRGNSASSGGKTHKSKKNKRKKYITKKRIINNKKSIKRRNKRNMNRHTRHKKQK